MKRTVLMATVIFSLLVSAAGNAPAWDGEQERKYSAYGNTVKGINAAFEPSYITLTGGYNRSKSIDTGDLWYEAQIAVHYNLFNNCRDGVRCERDNIFRAYIPIRLQVRQYTTDSSPVVTPSYNPGFRLYYWNTNWVTLGDVLQSVHYFSLGLHHYSNGQSGPHYKDGVINTKDGSFSSDYLELGYYYETMDKQGRPDEVWKLNVRKYLTGWTWETPQDNFYETWLTEVSRRKRLNRYGFTYQLTAGYKYGRKYVSPSKNASFKDNLQYRAEFILPVKCPKVRLFYWNDVSAYIRWDKGYDYYNIDYQNKINRIQFGFTASNF